MSRSKGVKMIPVMVHLTPTQIDMIQQLVDKRLFSCRAEFIRYAVTIALREYFKAEEEEG